jgi:hypothetical protein
MSSPAFGVNGVNGSGLNILALSPTPTWATNVSHSAGAAGSQNVSKQGSGGAVIVEFIG